MEESKKALSDEQKMIQEDIEKFAKLDSLANSDGGKLLIEHLRKNVLSALEMVLLGYKDMPEMELRSCIARANERLIILQTLTQSYGNKKQAEKELMDLLENNIE